MSWTIDIHSEVAGSKVTAEITFGDGASNKHYRKGKVKTFDIGEASPTRQAYAKAINPDCQVIMVAKFKKDTTGSNTYTITSNDSDMTAQVSGNSTEKGVILAVLVNSDGSKEIKAGKGTLGDVKKGSGI